MGHSSLSCPSSGISVFLASVPSGLQAGLSLHAISQYILSGSVPAANSLWLSVSEFRRPRSWVWSRHGPSFEWATLGSGVPITGLMSYKRRGGKATRSKLGCPFCPYILLPHIMVLMHKYLSYPASRSSYYYFFYLGQVIFKFWQQFKLSRVNLSVGRIKYR